MRLLLILGILFISSNVHAKDSSSTTPNQTICTAVQTKDGIVDECVDHEQEKPENKCNGMTAQNTSCAPGTEFDEKTCTCASICAAGERFHVYKNKCLPIR